MIIVSIGTSACNYKEKVMKEEVEREKIRAQSITSEDEKMKIPKITIVGTFDGCEVKFYERNIYRASDNFYIAKCSSTSSTNPTTTATNFEQVGGRFPKSIPMMSITTNQK